MNAAVHKAVIANDNNSNIAVAGDGTWHKRGYSSLNGVGCATCVENGMGIDFEALTKYCSSLKKVFSGSHRERLIEKVEFHGRTQNPNESFNKCIWEQIPKTVFVGIETLKLGVMDAVICFDDGYVSRIKVFEGLGIKPGYNTERALLIIDNKRNFEAERIVKCHWKPKIKGL
ncbi:uncharacterized protein TNCV_59011 [Trichonephila clavipes]|nr:uncharacterized protein TNCV_59011 [Trichonephila clavipes]